MYYPYEMSPMNVFFWIGNRDTATIYFGIFKSVYLETGFPTHLQDLLPNDLGGIPTE